MSAPIPIRIRGHIYKSGPEAAAAIGVRVGAIHNALYRGNPDGAGLGLNHSRKRPITMAGIRYGSHAEAAAAIGKTRSLVSALAGRARRAGGSFTHPKYGLIEVER